MPICRLSVLALLAMAASAPPLEPCKLLTKEQVATVLPGHTGGSTEQAGPSLIAGINAYQCSYLDAKFNLFTVIVHVAVDDARFEQIKPASYIQDEGKAVPVGDAAWVYGEPDELKLTAVKGRTLIDLSLRLPQAQAKTPALVTLAKAVAVKL